MNLAQLRKIVKEGESETLEFKNSTGRLSAAMQTVCAFLNSNRGGTLIFGVTDDGKIIGQSVSDKTQTDIAAESNKIDPYTILDIQYVPVSDGKKAIVITVEPGDHAPYTYDDRPYMRNQSTTTRMTKDRFSLLYNKFRQNLWETLTTHECTIKDLDAKRIKQVINMAVYNKILQPDELTKSIPTILKKMGLIIKDKLTNAAVILFCKNPDKQFSQCNVQMGRFRGIEKGEFLNKKYLKSNVFDMYDEAEKFLISSLPIAARIVPGTTELAKRVETPAIPYKVLREALVNALIHRDYSNQASSTFISIFDDRVNITNIGTLPEGIDLKQLSKDHPSIQRNPLIAQVFYLDGKIEKFGRGTTDMIRDCKNAGNPLPIYEELGGSFSITLPLKEPMRTIIYEEPQNVELTDRQKAILKALQKGPLKMPQIMDAANIDLKDRVMQLELVKLKKMGLIKSTGRTKSTTWTLIAK